MKKYSGKFWIIFWLTSVIFLIGWSLFWTWRHQGVGALSGAVDFLPIEAKGKYKALIEMADFVLQTKGETKTFLVLFQNNMELRPGGGYIGTFGIVKVKDGAIMDIQTHDLSNFDGRVPDGVEPPYPMRETLHIKNWKMRDSNFSPDFAVNARKAEEFYYLGQGGEKFDGVIGVTANVLTTALDITGPITIAGYAGTFDSQNAIIALEYQVEKGYTEQGVAQGDRKAIMNDLAREIAQRFSQLSLQEKFQVLKLIIKDLDQKDIQLYFHDTNLQVQAEKNAWAGRVDEQWDEDFLFAVDANLGAFKSDYYIRRSLDYTIDLTGEVPLATLKITYAHTAQQKDWMTRDYLTYLRVYVPAGSWLSDSKNFSSPQYGTEFGKKYFGAIVKVPIGSSKTVELYYKLTKENMAGLYDLKLQKQAGVTDEPVAIHVRKADGNVLNYDFLLNTDTELNELESKK